ncbi:hypothetical protein CAEBREN_30158 [Caenorhabditis brenneri]|uniref:Uncharacterized protein n=1 Tax=Caenorhabditis brenneri TaxID=135651 RepID=G0NZ27_CAEBE|nr:hypothetical protein CAEBREN_30158 [Caenorhabditis brenneri]
MTESRKGIALRELYWKTLVLGSHYPEEFNGGRFRSTPGELSYKNARVAKYQKPVTLEFFRRERSASRLESNEGDGMSMREETNLSGDPLTSIRTIRRVLEQKMEKANFDGKTIQATICLRAIQRIDEYEARIEELARRRSKALEVSDLQMAERHRLAMIDCRDTVFRAVHVDLLLDRDELRAIGVQSEWAG